MDQADETDFPFEQRTNMPRTRKAAGSIMLQIVTKYVQHLMMRFVHNLVVDLEEA